jgi:hypothetical protein
VVGDVVAIRFHDARLSMTAGSASSPTPVVIEDEVSPADRP